MTNPLPLMKVSAEPRLFVFESDAKTTAEVALGWLDAGLTVRVVRGRKMRTVQGLFDEIAAALQFPYYFGENWPALNECLADMDWLPRGSGIVIVVLDAGEVLVEEPQVELEAFIRSIVNASETYAQAIDEGEWWDRPAVPFHVVLQSSSLGVLIARWQQAGASVARLGA